MAAALAEIHRCLRNCQIAASSSATTTISSSACTDSPPLRSRAPSV